MVEQTAPGMGEGYLAYRGLLFGALAKLARQGFVVPPTEGLDLIHDFFVEAWSGLESRYDASKGSFEAYLYGAFVHFARPRIIRAQRLRAGLMDAAGLAEIVNARGRHADSPSESGADVLKVQEAVQAIPSPEREVLQRYVSDDEPSERDLASAFTITRYRVREMLVGALARVAVALDRPGGISAGEWEIARALWADGRTEKEAAAVLGVPMEQVASAKAHCLDILAEGLRGWHRDARRVSRRAPMNASHASSSPGDLLNAVLGSPGDRTLLEQVRGRAKEILDYLSSPEGAREWRSRAIECEPDWIAEVYGVMAANETPATSEPDSDPLFAAYADEERAVGRAFSGALLAGLPPALVDIRSWFEGLPEIPREEETDLLGQPVVAEGMPAAGDLARYGATPMTVFHATEAIAMLIRRMRRRGILDASAPVTLSREIESAGKPETCVARPAAIREIALVCECSEMVAERLYAWTIGLAQYKPLLFGGHLAQASGEGVSLRSVAAAPENLYERWGIATEYEARLAVRRAEARAPSKTLSISRDPAAEAAAAAAAAAAELKLNLLTDSGKQKAAKLMREAALRAAFTRDTQK